MEDIIWIENCLAEAEEQEDEEMIEYFTDMLNRFSE